MNLEKTNQNTNKKGLTKCVKVVIYTKQAVFYYSARGCGLRRLTVLVISTYKERTEGN